MVYYYVSYTVYGPGNVSKGNELFAVDNPMLVMTNFKAGLKLLDGLRGKITSKRDEYKNLYIHIDSISRL